MNCCWNSGVQTFGSALSNEVEEAASDAFDDVAVKDGGLGDGDTLRLLPKLEGTGIFVSELSPTKSFTAVARAAGDSFIQWN